MSSFNDFVKCLIKFHMNCLNTNVELIKNQYHCDRTAYLQCIIQLKIMKEIVDNLNNSKYRKDLKNAYIICKRLVVEIDYLYKIYESGEPNANEFFNVIYDNNFARHIEGISYLIELFAKYMNYETAPRLVLIDHKSIRGMIVQIDYIVIEKGERAYKSIAMEHGMDGYVLIPAFENDDTLVFRFGYEFGSGGELKRETLKLYDLKEGINLYHITFDQDTNEFIIEPMFKNKDLSEMIIELNRQRGIDSEIGVLDE